MNHMIYLKFLFIAKTPKFALPTNILEKITKNLHI